MEDRTLSTQCVQEIAALDTLFLQENAEAVRNAAEFPHAIMMLFAGYLSRMFAESKLREKLVIDQNNFIAAVLVLLEHYLLEDDTDVLLVIMDSFIDQIYDENLWLFDYLLTKAGPLLQHKMLTYKSWRAEQSF